MNAVDWRLRAGLDNRSTSAQEGKHTQPFRRRRTLPPSRLPGEDLGGVPGHRISGAGSRFFEIDSAQDKCGAATWTFTSHCRTAVGCGSCVIIQPTRSGSPEREAALNERHGIWEALQSTGCTDSRRCCRTCRRVVQGHWSPLAKRLRGSGAAPLRVRTSIETYFR